ncbi:LacI family transcriptional regulator [Chloroflexia bacterium SDU3-3]|nr:LacI family transcriptional regulator [Chloroflexia bacterium SDU3-3]
MPTKQLGPTIRDVARAAGVSIATASRVMNNRAEVAPETSARVRQAMEELGYTASLAARSMRIQATNIIGLVVPELTAPFNLEVVKGVGEAIQESSYDLVIYTKGKLPLRSRPAWEQEHLALLSGGLADGVIVVTPSAPRFEQGAKIVVIDPHGGGTDLPSVVATNRQGAQDAVAHLLGLGHRRIGFIGGREDAQSAADRLEGYRAALAQRGLDVDPSLTQPGDYTRESGYAATVALLALPQPPTAIFATCDAAALGAMDAARALGLRIPHDLSIMGFDNIPEAAMATPPLTTVDQSIQQLGFNATIMLLQMLQDEQPDPALASVPTRIVTRSTCQPIGELAPLEGIRQ